MYTTYFGLKEKPFSIAPDPQYLFMSDRHREALEHLTYGLGDAGGFVLLTGEVGTGKTTVSRCLMERLPDNTQAAFILNPTLSSHELLATLCDELTIRYRKTGATLKTLTDKIQDKLLKNHKDNMNTLLIIDEAQHLQPEVLEQLRLLTNLETNTKKLLQVILIGQPELQTLLKRRDLRQLAQRITARYHLLPLNKQEAAQYIKHRLSIAGGIRALFSNAAMKTIHQICGGIPRLMNLVCDRSLINACSSNNAVVSKRIVVLSAEEALGEDYKLQAWWQTTFAKIVGMIGVLFVVLVGVYFAGTSQLINKDVLSFFNTKTTFLKKTITKAPEKTNNNNQNTLTPNTLESDTLSHSNSASTRLALNNPEVIEGNTLSAKSKVANVPKSSGIKTEQSLNKDLLIETPSKHNAEKGENNTTLSVKKDVVKTPKKTTTKVVTTQVNVKAKVNANAQKPQNKIVELTKVNGVSDQLLSQFQAALKDENENTTSPRNSEHSLRNVTAIENMPLWVQDGIPQLQFEQHIYASDGKGWVNVNGRDRYEGDSIARELILVEILPQKVVLNFRGEKFYMRALSSW